MRLKTYEDCQMFLEYMKPENGSCLTMEEKINNLLYAVGNLYLDAGDQISGFLSEAYSEIGKALQKQAKS